MAMELDYIIVGQGIAGTVLSHCLLKKKKKILVIDDPSYSSASKIAAGLFNPVVFMRLVKSWKADDLLVFADEFYADAENTLAGKFYFKKGIVKIFSEEHEKDFWKKKQQEEIGKFLSDISEEEFFLETVNSFCGHAEVKNSGNLNVLKFLDLSRIYFAENNLLLQERFNFESLNVRGDSVDYKNIKTNKIIFCEGYRATENPYFHWLPFKLTKGELITVRIKNFNIDRIINKGVFVLPLGNDLFKVGSTYEWNEIDQTSTEKGRLELIEKLDKILKVPYEVVEQEAGVRPTVKDRRPLIGLHPEHRNMGVFNGMGTKAVMLAPYFANQFTEFLEHDLALDEEVNISRFVFDQ